MIYERFFFLLKTLNFDEDTKDLFIYTDRRVTMTTIFFFEL